MDNELLEAALIGYHQQHAAISAKIADVQERLGGQKSKGVIAPSGAKASAAAASD